MIKLSLPLDIFSFSLWVEKLSSANRLHYNAEVVSQSFLLNHE